jgi:hypothetical protein
MKQADLYEPIRRWLAGEGFAAMVTGANMSIVIPISGLVPMPFKIPDVIGIKDGRVVIVEVERRKATFFDAFGRCLLWKCTASYVYLAYPAGVIGRAPILKKFGLGLLTVDPTSGVVSAPIQLPRDGLDFRVTQELYPLDPVAEQQLYRQLETSSL